MTSTPAEHLAEITHSLALAQANLKRAFSALEKYETAMGVRSVPKRHSIRCVQVWQEWLAVNGPNTRKHITDATGTKLTERATPHTVVWDYGIDPTDDSAYPDDTLFRIRAQHDGGGRGAPPVVYFLWSQRFDVHPRFGVGPVVSDGDGDGDGETVTDGTATGLRFMVPDEMAEPDPQAGDRLVAEVERLLTEPVDGTVQRTSVPTDGAWEAWEGTDAVSEPEPVRYANLDEWNAAHGPMLDAIVAADAKPTEAQKEILRSTLPDGVNGNEAIATAYSEAVRRARQPQSILGVIQPPATEGVSVDHGFWSDEPFDYGDGDGPEETA